MNDEALNKAFCKVIGKLRNHEHQKCVFYDVRNNIDKVVQNCSDNVIVYIYFYVLDDPIIICAGNAENVLEIYIDNNEEASYVWTELTWTKIARDIVGF